MLRPTIATPAIVLRRTAYGEADLVVTLLGLQTGRVSALARGARKSSRRFAGGLGMGLGGDATLRDRPGAELMSLEGFDASGYRQGLSSEIAKTAHTAYAVELCDRLCPPRQPDKAVFAWLDEFLARLAVGTATADRLRVFELGLLRRLGIGPSLDRCTICGREDLEAEDVRWHPAGGGVVCRRCARGGDLMSGSTRQALERLGRASLSDADSIRLDRDVSSGCRRAMLALLREHVHGPLRSLDFIEKMGSGMSGSR
jgi:DNA repair protein RecO (recombination protein O)